jgi:hypothetical protein
MRVVLDGESFDVLTKPADMLAAERALARDKIANPIETAPIQTQTRLMFAAFGRSYPDHPAARDWPKFVELLDDYEDLDVNEPGELLDPTQSADTANSP